MFLARGLGPGLGEGLDDSLYSEDDMDPKGSRRWGGTADGPGGLEERSTCDFALGAEGSEACLVPRARLDALDTVASLRRLLDGRASGCGGAGEGIFDANEV